MPQNIFGHILLLIVLAGFFGSGFLLWPLRRWLCRKRAARGRSLGFVFLFQIVASAVWTLFYVFRHEQMLDYEWSVLWVEINVVFTIAGVFAWFRDVRHERRLEADHAA